MKIILFTSLVLMMMPHLSAAQNLQHVVVYQQDGRFAAWPANNGAWIFEGDEMLVGFTEDLEPLAEFGRPHVQHTLSMVVIHLPCGGDVLADHLLEQMKVREKEALWDI